MARSKQSAGPTQPTQPRKKGAKPIEIPVPKRSAVDDVLKRAARPLAPRRSPGE